MISKFFINRPIFATVIAIVMVLVGLVTIYTLPVAQFPDIHARTMANVLQRAQSFNSICIIGNRGGDRGAYVILFVIHKSSFFRV